MNRVVLAVALALLLGACGDKPQTLQASRRDTPAYTGTGKAFVNPDWKPGDRASWESHLKARSQHGMNDYTRMN